jgi:hypothetical protein
MYYSGMDFTYKLDRTTVTVGAPSILAMSVDAKCAPSANHTASRTSWLHTCKESQDVPVNFS